VAEAARRLGVTPTAVRNRIERGTLESKPHGNRGRLVRLRDGVRHGDDTGSEHGALTGAARAPVTIARLEERLAAVEAACADRDRELAEVKAERDRLLTLVEQLAAERRQRRPWPGLRAWWRRFVEGEG
jgi:chromosome segregation ATPase